MNLRVSPLDLRATPLHTLSWIRICISYKLLANTDAGQHDGTDVRVSESSAVNVSSKSGASALVSFFYHQLSYACTNSANLSQEGVMRAIIASMRDLPTLAQTQVLRNTGRSRWRGRYKNC